jgi:hypothetical protein
MRIGAGGSAPHEKDIMRLPPPRLLCRAAAIACALWLVISEMIAALETIPLMFA